MDRLFSTLDSLPSTKLGGTRFLFGNISAAMEPDKVGPTAGLNPSTSNWGWLGLLGLIGLAGLLGRDRSVVRTRERI
jgi:hypothetical protein